MTSRRVKQDASSSTCGRCYNPSIHNNYTFIICTYNNGEFYNDQLILEQPKKAPETKAAGNSFESRVLPRTEGVGTSELGETEMLAVVRYKGSCGRG